MVEPEEAKKATATQNPVIDGRVANVNLAYLGAKKMNNSPSGMFLLNTSAILKIWVISIDNILKFFYYQLN